MKKILLVTLLLCASMSGCGKKTAVLACSMQVDQVVAQVDISVNIEHLDETILTIVMDQKMTFESTDVASELKGAMEQTAKAFEGIEGISFNYKIGDKDITATTEVDYKKLPDELKPNVITGLNKEDMKSIAGISAALEKQGFTCSNK